MASLKAKDIHSALTKKGFEVDKKSGNTDHTYYRLFNANGEKTSITTRISHGEKEIRDPLIKKMSSQMMLKKKEFIKYVECTISREAYLKMVKQN